MNLPIIDAESKWLPRRAGAFGQGRFAVSGWPEQRHTFLVEGWADSDGKPCQKKVAAFAVIYCGQRFLLRLEVRP